MALEINLCMLCLSCFPLGWRRAHPIPYLGQSHKNGQFSWWRGHRSLFSPHQWGRARCFAGLCCDRRTYGGPERSTHCNAREHTHRDKTRANLERTSKFDSTCASYRFGRVVSICNVFSICCYRFFLHLQEFCTCFLRLQYLELSGPPYIRTGKVFCRIMLRTYLYTVIINVYYPVEGCIWQINGSTSAPTTILHSSCGGFYNAHAELNRTEHYR